ncbi:MAG: molybdenum cofactor biosynthesis protein MoaE [Gammaproteobacteria bacterium]|nr:molybdenum cofactor biosynthesis protein MoaE [Gammaproteobacteria bacterium]
MTICLIEDRFDPWVEVSQHHQTRLRQQNHCGATAVFVGTMRDFNEDTSVSSMFLEHYPNMTENQLHIIVDQACEQWQIEDILLIHRVGYIYPSDAIVLVATWAIHRGDAYDSNRFIMEQLKSSAPFWKKETVADSSSVRWVQRNTDGYTLKKTETEL